jgi:hypothetical protein
MFEAMNVKHHGDQMPHGWNIACQIVREQSAAGAFDIDPDTLRELGEAPALNKVSQTHGARTYLMNF